MRMSLIDLLRAGRNLLETTLEDNLLGRLSAELVTLEAEIDLSAKMDLSAETDLSAEIGFPAETDLSAEIGFLAETNLSAGMSFPAETDLSAGMDVLEEEANCFPVDLDKRPAVVLGYTGG
nr:hypothetical protein [Tanacetum cinerariifolium]